MTTTETHTVRGLEVTTRTRTPYTYLVVELRTEPFTFEGRTGTRILEPYAAVLLRTEKLEAARRAVRKFGRGAGAFAVIIHTGTGEEVV